MCKNFMVKTLSSSNNFFDFKVVCLNIDEIIDEIMNYIDETQTIERPTPISLSCLNPHSFVVAQRDFKFKRALINSTYLVCDGIGVYLAQFIASSSDRFSRITGPDFFEHFMMRISKNKEAKVFFLGGDEESNKILVSLVRENFGLNNVEGFSPPFKDEFSDADNELIADRIDEFGPDVLWIGMSAPKQEKWMYANYDRLGARFVGCIGAAFDFYTGRVPRAPKILRVIGMEWVFRSIVKPKQLGRRNLASNPRFVLLMLKQLFLK